MTAVAYSDCRAVSPNGTFVLEARSPHNGTIDHRDGRPATDEEFGFRYRHEQSDFRYRLLENNGGCVVWERWQTSVETSPAEVLVSDEGWSVLRTADFRPELIVVSPFGQETVHVRICGDGSEHRGGAWQAAIPTFDWYPKSLICSTAGMHWTQNSWRYFFRLDDTRYFAWRDCFGGRLLLDLARGIMLTDDQQVRLPLAKALAATSGAWLQVTSCMLQVFAAHACLL